MSDFTQQRIDESRRYYADNERKSGISLDSSHQELQYGGEVGHEVNKEDRTDRQSSEQTLLSPPRFNVFAKTSFSTSASQGSNFQTVIKIRPTSKSSILDDSSSSIIDMGEDMRTLTVGKKHGKNASDKYPSYHFTFDRVFDEYCNQQLFYQSSCAPLVKNLMKGISSTVFAYGQTRSGKTFTLEGVLESDRRGLISRSMEDLFAQIKTQTTDGPHGNYYVVKATYVQIYNDIISDLLCHNSHNLKIVEEKQKGVFVNGAKQHTIKEPSDIATVIKLGRNNRTTQGTKPPDLHSRSHTILTVIVEQVRPIPPKSPRPDSFKYARADMVSVVMRSKIHFVELAGSERARDFTNLSLSSVKNDDGVKISKVFNALSAIVAFLSRTGNHIPYRDTKLTHLLKDTLNQQSLCLFIATIYPLAENYHETMATLKYSSRIRQSSSLIHSGQGVLETSEELTTPVKQKLGEDSSNISETNISRILERDEDQMNPSNIDNDDMDIEELINNSQRLEQEVANSRSIIQRKYEENEILMHEMEELKLFQAELIEQNHELRHQVDDLRQQNSATLLQLKQVSEIALNNAAPSRSIEGLSSPSHSTVYTTSIEDPDHIQIIQTTTEKVVQSEDSPSHRNPQQIALDERLKDSELESQRLRSELSETRKLLSQLIVQKTSQEDSPSKSFESRKSQTESSNKSAREILTDSEVSTASKNTNLRSQIESELSASFNRSHHSDSDSTGYKYKWNNNSILSASNNSIFVRQYEDSVRDLSNELELLRKQIRIKDSTIREYITETQNLKLKVESVESRKSQIEHELDNFKLTMEDVNDRLRSITKEKEFVENELIRSRNELSEVKDEKKDVENQLRTLKQDRDTLHMKIQTLTNEMNRALVEKESIVYELIEARENNIALNSQYDSCQRQLSQSEGELRQCHLNYSVLQNESRRLEKELLSLSQEYSTYKEEQTDRKRFFDSEVERLKDEIAKARSQLQAKNEEIVNADDESKRLRNALRDSEMEVERVREAYEKTNKDLKDIIATFGAVM